MSWTLMIVEDDPDIRESLGDVLLARGFQVLLARDGQDAIGVTTRVGSRPALIVLDLMMPEMDGMTFLEHQAAHPLLAQVPVIVLTAMNPPPAQFPENVVAVFSKPIPLAEMIEVIRQVVSLGGGGRLTGKTRPIGGPGEPGT
jgi:CheY-like chemotaxis protein